MRPRHVALALAATAALTSCGTSSPPAPAAATTSHTPNVADVAYLAAVRPQIQGSTDADLIALGHKACASFAESGAATQLQVVQEFADLGFSPAAAVAITMAATQSYCPEYKDEPTS